MANLIEINGKASSLESAIPEFHAAILNGQNKKEAIKQWQTQFFTFKVNHSMHNDDTDDILSILNIIPPNLKPCFCLIRQILLDFQQF